MAKRLPEKWNRLIHRMGMEREDRIISGETKLTVAAIFLINIRLSTNVKSVNFSVVFVGRFFIFCTNRRVAICKTLIRKDGGKAMKVFQTYLIVALFLLGLPLISGCREDPCKTIRDDIASLESQLNDKLDEMARVPAYKVELLLSQTTSLLNQFAEKYEEFRACEDEVVDEIEIRATWMYNFADFDNETEVDFLSKMYINQVFLSISADKLDPLPVIDEEIPPQTGPDEDYINKLVQFIQLAKSRGIDTHAMTLQAPKYSLAIEHSKALNKIQRILLYNKNHVESAFGGIHIDTEPHALRNEDPESNPFFHWWSRGDVDEDVRWSRNEVIMTQYLELLRRIRSAIDAHTTATGQSLVFSAAIAWWFNEKSTEIVEDSSQVKLRSGAATKLAEHVDVLVPMVYHKGPKPWNTKEDLINRAHDEVQDAPTIIGIGVGEFTKSPPSVVILTSGVYLRILNVIDELSTDLGGETHFKGTSIYDYEKLKDVFELYQALKKVFTF